MKTKNFIGMNEAKPTPVRIEKHLKSAMQYHAELYYMGNLSMAIKVAMCKIIRYDKNKDYDKLLKDLRK